MSKNLVELKALPCPFCGELPIKDVFHGSILVKCMSCQGVQWMLLEQWNRRTP